MVLLFIVEVLALSGCRKENKIIMILEVKWGKSLYLYSCGNYTK